MQHSICTIRKQLFFHPQMYKTLTDKSTKMSYNKFLNKINGDLNIYAQNSA